MPSSARYAVEPVAGRIASVSTKFGITCTRSTWAGRTLAATLPAQVVAEHRHRVGAVVADALEPARRRAIIRRLLMAPVRTAASGNTSWMLNTSGARRHRPASHPVRPSVSGGDIASTTSARRNHPPARSAGHAGERGEPGEADRAPHQVRLVAAGERVDAGDRAPRRGLGAHPPPGPARFDAVLAVPGQGGDDVQLVAERGELADDPRHHRAGRGGVGFEVGAQDDDLHGALILPPARPRAGTRRRAPHRSGRS